MARPPIPYRVPFRAVLAPEYDGVDGNFEVVEVENDGASVACLESSLRMLARMMIHTYQESDHSKLNAQRKNESSSLTLLPTPSPHDWNDRTA